MSDPDAADANRPRNELVPAGGDVDDGTRGGAAYWLLKSTLSPVVKAIFRPKVEGLEHVPVDGPAIIASNHLSVADWLFTPIALKRRITYVAKSDYFTGSGLKGFLQRGFFSGTGQVPIDRSGGRASEAALAAGAQVLRRGELFGIFPEGTRSPDGRLYKGRTGIARLALTTGAPVVPAGVIGTDKIAPKDRHFGKVHSPTVRFGPPLDLTAFVGRAHDRGALRAATDQVMQAIRALTGQVYVDEYAPRTFIEPAS
ncbi:lysophospholipid acyltransferase family protein [Naumannella cuiyingiana]|uniref:1-acyl-sn-glycerol-3-phosphate acyltransferase n=1 Tax=Naumannella cuiyingiana TaxID=1347891 RepID=A0A7Z0DAZ9_9ACTN|nr:lysophospholipid acyltransferase family protein [Naumannella cuiyingiana]NYI72057.1 1-acyl-sn-glycerol-3-phosphate acyltransferase [Naumannella cuiyingiana]